MEISEKSNNTNKIVPVNKDDYNKVESQNEVKKRERKEKAKLAWKIINAIGIRILFLVEAFVLLFFSICIVNNNFLIFLIILMLVIVADGLYVAIRNKGVEHSWFSISVASYSIIFVICVWVIVFYKLNLGDPSCTVTNSTLSAYSNCVSSTYTACDALILLVQLILIFFTIGRWQMEIEGLSRDAHIDYIVTLLIACADSSDFFKYVQENTVKNNYDMVTAIMFFFTTSVIQFSLTTTTVRKRSENQLDLTTFQLFVEIMFGTKLWSITFLAITQDIPYFIMRLILLIGYNMKSDRSIYLYIIKNFILVYLDVYKAYFILKEFFEERRKLKKINKSQINQQMMESIKS